MLPKKERLSRDAFSRFFSMGKRHHSPSLQVVYTPYESLHVSVVVPKKVQKSAVKRNKIRRRIYDIVRNYRKERGIQGVFIFLAKATIIELAYVQMKEEVQKQIEHILKNRH